MAPAARSVGGSGSTAMTEQTELFETGGRQLAEVGTPSVSGFSAGEASVAVGGDVCAAAVTANPPTAKIVDARMKLRM